MAMNSYLVVFEIITDFLSSEQLFDLSPLYLALNYYICVCVCVCVYTVI